VVTRRTRKSPFVRLFTKTPEEVICPHFYELILSNGCPFDCLYCYLKLTFRGKKHPVLFTNPWYEVEKELEVAGSGVFSTGELADSLAIVPPLLAPAVEYFRKQKGKFLLLVTKSTNISLLRETEPTPQVIVSFSINSIPAWERFEKKTPHPYKRLKAAEELKKLGWRVRIRIDPIIWEAGLESYRDIAERVRDLAPEVVTVGTLRQYPGLFLYEKRAPKQGLEKAEDGRMRYPVVIRRKIYTTIAEWLGFQPALCKETRAIWKKLKWKFTGCNCTEGQRAFHQDQKFLPTTSGKTKARQRILFS